jgi:hypothetical protein
MKKKGIREFLFWVFFKPPVVESKNQATLPQPNQSNKDKHEKVIIPVNRDGVSHVSNSEHMLNVSVAEQNVHKNMSQVNNGAGLLHTPEDAENATSSLF